jgi:hypothetical protein
MVYLNERMNEVHNFIIQGLVKHTVIWPIILILHEVSPPPLFPRTPQETRVLDICWRAW